MTIEIDELTKNLLNEMGFIPSEKDPKLFEIEIENGKAFIDFRKENGRRYASLKGVMVKPDNISILQAFKEQREKLQLSVDNPEDKEKREASSGNMGQQLTPVKTPPVIKIDVGDRIPAAPTFDYIKDIVGDDILELFGDTGTGKSKFVHALALEAIAAGKSVYYLDTERNLSKADVIALGESYHYTPLFTEIKELVLKNLPKVDMVVIDSVGLPILTRFATYSMKERGNALLDLIAVVGRLKEWAYENSALAVITNQPESEFGKQEGDIRKPFGDKACFAAKEIWLTRKLKAANMTKCSVESFRSRSMKGGLNIFQIEITDQGTKIVR